MIKTPTSLACWYCLSPAMKNIVEASMSDSGTFLKKLCLILWCDQTITHQFRNANMKLNSRISKLGWSFDFKMSLGCQSKKLLVFQLYQTLKYSGFHFGGLTVRCEPKLGDVCQFSSWDPNSTILQHPISTPTFSLPLNVALQSHFHLIYLIKGTSQ
jgi:hypothetical protein